MKSSAVVSSSILNRTALATILDTVVTVERDITAVQYVTVSSFALLIYDILLTFEKEYQHIWSARQSMGTLLYLFIRYANLLLTAANVYYTQAKGPPEYCRLYLYIDTWFSITCMIPILVVLAFRTYALCECKTTAKWFLSTGLVITSLAFIACSIISTVGTHFTELMLPGSTCLLSISETPKIASILVYGASVAFSTVILFITVLKVHQLCRFGQAKLMRVIMRDNLVYFVVILCECLAALLLYTSLPTRHSTLRALLVDHSRVMATIATSRIVLNLRGFADGEEGSTMATCTVPHFLGEYHDGHTSVPAAFGDADQDIPCAA